MALDSQALETPSSSAGPAVLAFGGNALLPDPFRPEQQEERARELARAVLLLLRRSSGLVLVHGNGPQVGMILLRVEATKKKLPTEPLDTLVAETQGSIGILLARALRNAVVAEGSWAEVMTLLTQVIVDPNDPAFARPEKPIGPHYTDEQAQLLSRERSWFMMLEEDKGWRRAVASPRPLRVVEMPSIEAAARAGRVVIAGGGGGVPVIDQPGHGLRGIEAVVDKDRTASLLATSLAAGIFCILTGVPSVQKNFGKKNARRIDRLSVTEARELLARGEFPPGSMAPKIEAALEYVERTRREALITDTTNLNRALDGEEGTVLHI
ncbi:MAG: carbamate kinase [Planctomycetes bacterium]|nr:carbamate kinase [Planctomycetota bacterium]